MLFNSYEFLLAFLPISLIVFFILGRWAGKTAAMLWLVIASFFFYGWWDTDYLWLISASLVVNFGSARLLSNDDAPLWRRKTILIAALVGNLCLLGYYRYANFFVENVNEIVGTQWHLERIILPLAISFFTFQQIAFVVDAYRGTARESGFLPYCLFVTFFPQFIAGPIVHHREMLPQFREKKRFQFQVNDFSIGLTIFCIGLFKKVIIADELAIYASAAFAGAEDGMTFTFFEAWTAALSYTMQLYFDFSGYSDMAVGLGRLFGIKLPLNFNSPYKALNIIDFWRRWHITLSRFLRDYLYIPLGGNRKGPIRRQTNLMITMILGGLWHGAGWTFIFWGALHGTYLVINHAWSNWRKSRSAGPVGFFGKANAWTLTFIAVVVSWVFFRATSFEGALRIVAGMFGLNGISLPGELATKLAPLQHLTHGWFSFNGIQVNALPIGLDAAAWVLAASFVAFFLPNIYQIMLRYEPSFETKIELGRFTPKSWIIWSPSRTWAVAISLISVWTFLNLSRVSEFLYFQF